MICVIEECLFNDHDDNCTKRADHLTPNSTICKGLEVPSKHLLRTLTPDIDYRLSRLRGGHAHE